MNLFFRTCISLLGLCWSNIFLSTFLLSSSYSLFSSFFYLYSILKKHYLLLFFLFCSQVIGGVITMQNSFMAYGLPILFILLGAYVRTLFNVDNGVVIYTILIIFSVVQLISNAFYSYFFLEGSWAYLGYEILPIMIINGIVTMVHVYKKQTAAQGSSL